MLTINNTQNLSEQILNKQDLSEQNFNSQNLEKIDRFTRSRWLFGDDFIKLQRAKILVCGCGGVGGAAISALYRCGVGHISVLDCDSFDITNQNRQIGSEFVGELKAEVFSRLFAGIIAFNLRIDENSINKIDFSAYDIVIDAIDDVKAKILLAKKCDELDIGFFSSLGAARRIDASKISVKSIWQTSNDPFARKIRYELRRANFKGDFMVVCSNETPKCTRLGSFMGVTASFGLMLASLCVEKICK